MYDLRNNLFFEAFFTTADTINDIARMAPVVAWMRSDALMASMAGPNGFDGAASLEMVTEKIAAAAEGALRATMAAGAGMGGALLTGTMPHDLPFRIADAAMEPILRRVQANYDDLTGSEAK